MPSIRDIGKELNKSVGATAQTIDILVRKHYLKKQGRKILFTKGLLDEMLLEML